MDAIHSQMLQKKTFLQYSWNYSIYVKLFPNKKKNGTKELIKLCVWKNAYIYNRLAAKGWDVWTPIVSACPGVHSSAFRKQHLGFILESLPSSTLVHVWLGEHVQSQPAYFIPLAVIIGFGEGI
jgi:hypothetical protein